MGTFTYKGGASYHRSIGQNLMPVAASYEYSNGYFGDSSPSTGNRTRNIASQDNIETAKDFYDKLSYGGVETSYDNGNRKISHMADGTIITMRQISSSDKTPVVEINISKSTHTGGIKKQKIHFILENE